MKKALLAIAATLVMLAGTAQADPSSALSDAQAKQETERAKSLLKDTIYVKDPRTNLCFAYLLLAKFPVLGNEYPPAGIATVPCVRIPDSLLAQPRDLR